jgi:hypothetical protein
MILDEKIIIKVNPAQIKHFKTIGLDVKPYDIIEISPHQLNSGSNIKINCKCDVCGDIKKHAYRKYIRSVKNCGYYSCSIKCAKEKIKKTFMDKYGYEHHFMSEESKNKIKKTWLNNYGSEHFANSEKYGEIKNDIIKKRKDTVYKKYAEKDNILRIDDFEIVKYCHKHQGEFSINKKLYHNRKRITNNDNVICTVCNPLSENNSLLELDLLDFIRHNISNEVISNHRDGGKEIDIFIPNLNIGFEFNGLYWHNELHKENDYHKNKTDFFNDKNIKIIHIWEDDWVLKSEIVKSRVLNLLGKTKKKIYARKCVIKEIGSKEYKDFLKINHIQGSINSSIKLGLYYDGELVSAMGLGSLRKVLGSKSKLGYYELLRYCSKLNTLVVGGSSKLFKYFIDKYKPTNVISYADRSWSNGNLYEKMGFTLKSITKPNYYYILDKIRVNRYNFRKDVLIRGGYDHNKTEHQIMLDRGIYRIYDSGSLVYEFNPQTLNS